MAAEESAKKRSLPWRRWSPRDQKEGSAGAKLAASTDATNVKVSASSEKEENSRKIRRRHTLAINIKMLGRAIANGSQKMTSHFYNDVSVDIDKVKGEKEVGETTLTATRDKAATLPAAASNITVPTSSGTEDGRRGKSKKSRRHTLGFGLFSKAVAKGRQQASLFYNDDRNDINEKLKGEELREATPSWEPNDKATAEPAVAIAVTHVTVPASLETEDRHQGKIRKSRRHTLGFGLLDNAVAKGRQQASNFYNDDRNDVTDKLEGEEVREATLSTAPKDKAATLPAAASIAVTNVTISFSSKKKEGRQGEKTPPHFGHWVAWQSSCNREAGVIALLP